GLVLSLEEARHEAVLVEDLPMAGDVRHASDQPEAPPQIAERRLRDRVIPRHAAGIGDRPLRAPLAAAREDGLVVVPDRLGLVLGQEIEDRLAQDGVAGMPPDAAALVVEHHDAVPAVLDEDRVENALIRSESPISN